MHIISYMNYENNVKEPTPQNQEKTQERRSLLRRASSLSFTTSDAIGMSINTNLVSKYEITAQKHRDFKFLKPILTVLVVLSFIAFLGLAFLYFRDDFNLDRFSNFKDSAVKEAFFTYLFPSDEGSTNTLTATSSIIQEVSFQTYTIKSGDTISGIASKFGLRSMGTLIALNDIENAKRIQVGMKLKIPSTDGLFHSVKKGETLASIAAKYNLTVNSILDSNNLETDLISIGDKLFIPGAKISNFELKKALGELFIFPVSGRLTSPFGYRKDPFTGVRSFHNGIDLANSSGTAIKCIMDGRVSEVGYNSVYGNYIIITHDGGYQSMYGHLKATYVKRGNTVLQGTRIGSMGSTGRSTGPHLHLSIYKNGKVIDPLSVLNN